MLVSDSEASQREGISSRRGVKNENCLRIYSAGFFKAEEEEVKENTCSSSCFFSLFAAQNRKYKMLPFLKYTRREGFNICI